MAKPPKEKSDKFVNPRPKWSAGSSVYLWVRCGGRCSICKTYLLKSPLTGRPISLGQFAHIIAHGEYGPRPRSHSDYPEDYIDTIDNIIVLCKNCHDEIDRDESNYSEQWLRDKKAEHERNIELQTLPSNDDARLVVTFSSPIGKRGVTITPELTREALFQNGCFPRDERNHDINLTIPKDEKSRLYWDTASILLKDKFTEDIIPCIHEGKRIAAFGIAPMPLLVLFGSLLCDYGNVDVYNLFRNERMPWAWRSKNCNNGFQIILPDNISEVKKKVLVFSITSDIRERVEEQNPDSGTAIWEIRPSVGPSRYEYIESAQQLNMLEDAIRDVLDKIDKVDTNEVHIYMAMSNSAAVCLGKARRPKANDKLIIYDYISAEGRDIYALTI